MEEARGDWSEGDLERLSSELDQERQMRDMLHQSASELRNTVSHLEKRLDSVEDEGNEWRTRFETQQELNIQLERQIRTLEEKVEYIRGNPADRLASVRSYEEMPVAYHKANDERRTYLAEIAQTSLSIETAKKQKAIGSREKKVLKGKYNVPTTQRILDLQKGPIKKTAAMKRLPKLKH
ncbi:coiled-coil domain containing 169 isoform X4 [Heptranchias perlo]|uniref:coiled-coil domain containing 169 isoform X4 n=1 Tax=Heptranchias perlo TaxID=212740 RepID=UPI003559F190